MPRHCSVAGCRSNYDPNDHITTFQIPKTEPQRTLWLRKIPTDFKNIKKPIICIRHFRESDIVRKDCLVYKGEYREFDRKIPKLKDGAFPCIFPNLSPYLSCAPTSSRRLADVESDQLSKAIQESLSDHRDYLEKKRVKKLSDVVKFLEDKKMEMQRKWFYLLDDTTLRVCYYKVDNDNVSVLATLSVCSDLTFKVYVDNVDVSGCRFFREIKNISDIDIVEKLLNGVERCVNIPEKKTVFDTAILLLESCVDEMGSQEINFMMEQLKLSVCPKNCRRYSNKTLVVAASIYTHSTSAYNSLRKCGVLCLPSNRLLQSMIAQYSLGSVDLASSMKYLNTKVKYLKDHEHLVNILLDEIYIEAQYNFKGGSVYGAADGNATCAAKTAQIFMVSSVFSTYKDVVCIVPILNLNADNLQKLMISVLEEVEKIGLKVISFISDNNSVNRRAFELMTSNHTLQPFITHPLDESRLLFFIFDSVHLVKCIRNNWMNKTDIFFPDFENMSLPRKANFKHLLILHDLEKNSLVKYGHTLNNKSLYPTNLQKQNVSLALKVINEKNVAALKCVSKDYPELFEDVEDTCMFLDIFVKWWKVVNCHSAFEGKRFNDSFREPVRRDNNFHVNFFRKMSDFIVVWKQTYGVSALSMQTFQSLKTTCDAFLNLIPYVFQQCSADYLLLGKFQTDALEARFGAYRQMSGANYYISFVQVLESERKLRFQGNLLLSSTHENIPLKSLLPEIEEEDSQYVNIDAFLGILIDDFNVEVVPKEKLPIITYIGGYAAKKEIRQKCDICLTWLRLDKEIEVDFFASEGGNFDLICELDRGKLTLPTECVIVAVSASWLVANDVIKYHEHSFLSSGQQLRILHKLSCVQLIRANLHFSEVCNCGTSLLKRLENICLLASKIMLSNYVKYKNDIVKEKKKCARKVKKFCA